MSESQIVRPAPRQPRSGDAVPVHRGPIFTVWNWTSLDESGQRKTFESLSRADTALVVPVLDEGNVLLGYEEQAGEGRLLRALGGRIEPGESPVEAAARELREEGGVEAQTFTLWRAWQPVEKIDWALYLFVATDVVEGLGQHLDDGEVVTPVRFAAEDFFTATGRSRLDDPELKYALYVLAEDSSEQARIMSLLGLHANGSSVA